MFKESHFHTQVIQQSQTITNYQTMRTLETQEKGHFLYSGKAPDCGISLYLKINILGLILIELSR